MVLLTLLLGLSSNVWASESPASTDDHNAVVAVDDKLNMTELPSMGVLLGNIWHSTGLYSFSDLTKHS